MFGSFSAIFAYISRMVGNRTDPTDANGSLHSKVSDVKSQVSVRGVAVKQVVASSTVRLSSNSEVSTTETTPAVVKRIAVTKPGTCRVSFNLKCSHSNGRSYAQIYKNGAAYGPAVETYGSTYQTHTQDMYFNTGDLIEIYAYNNSGSETTAFVNNLRVMFDDTNASDGYVLI